MSEEIRNEEIEVTEVVAAEDVKEGLGPMEYGVIVGIAGAGIAAWELGKLGWRKTEKPRKKVKEFVSGIFSKNKDSKGTEALPEHEVVVEKAAETTEEKKSDKKNSKK